MDPSVYRVISRANVNVTKTLTETVATSVKPISTTIQVAKDVIVILLVLLVLSKVAVVYQSVNFANVKIVSKVESVISAKNCSGISNRTIPMDVKVIVKKH